MTDNQHPTKREQVVAAISAMHAPYIDAHVRALNNLPRTTAHPYVEEAEVCKIPTKFVNDLADWHLTEVEKAETNAIAWVIGLIDRIHLNAPPDLDKEYKGLKNTIRDAFEMQTGVDPAPHYPVKAQLRQHIEERKQ